MMVAKSWNRFSKAGGRRAACRATPSRLSPKAMEARLAGADASLGESGSKKDARESIIPTLSMPTAISFSKSASAPLALLVTVGGYHPNAGNEVVL